MSKTSSKPNQVKLRINPTVTITDSLEAILRWLRGLEMANQRLPKPKGFFYRSYGEFLLKHGLSFTERVQTEPMLERQCFANAQRLARRRPKRLFYAEGQAVPGHGIPLEHAWCVDKQGRVHDPTWADGQAYFGVVFKIAYVRQSVRGRKTCNLILDYERRYPVFRLPTEEWKQELVQSASVNGVAREAVHGHRSNLVARRAG